jgi:hypothetical protein
MSIERAGAVECGHSLLLLNRALRRERLNEKSGNELPHSTVRRLVRRKGNTDGHRFSCLSDLGKKSSWFGHNRRPRGISLR